MFKKLVPVNKERHNGQKIKRVEGFAFAAPYHIAAVMAHEFVRAAAIYPIVFLEDKDKDGFRPVALMGLEAGENLFLDENGKWKAAYIPAIIRRYPFALANSGDEGRFTVCIDEGSELVNDTEGEPMFDADGNPGPLLENVKRYLGELQQMDMVTRDFCRLLAELNMFTPLNMRIRQNESIKNITGCYVINEERLNKLSDERFLELRSKRYLSPIFAHLNSLAQIERLMKLKKDQQDDRNGAAQDNENPAENDSKPDRTLQ